MTARLSYFQNEKSLERKIYWMSFATRCVLGLAAWWVTTHSQVTFFEDALGYYQVGTDIAQEWLTSGSSITLDTIMGQTTPNAWAMVLLVAVLSFLGNGLKSMPILMILYAFITSWTPVITYKIARSLGLIPPSALFAAMFVVFSPCFAFWGGALYKDGLVFLVLNMIIYHVILLQKRLRISSIVIISVLIFFLLALRFYLPVLLVPSLALGLLLGKRKDLKSQPRRDFSFFNILLRQGFIIAVFVLVLSFFGYHKLIYNMTPTSVDSFFEYAQEVRTGLTQKAASSYLEEVDIKNPVSALNYLPKGIGYFLTVPFPWQRGSLRQNLILPEMIFWLCLYPIIFLGMIRGLRLNFQGSILLIIVTVVMTFYYGLYISNIGTAYRMRSQIWLFWVIFLGWHHEKKYLEKLRGHPLTRRSI